MLCDAYERRADSLVLISGDTDLAPIVKTIRYYIGVPVLVFNPQTSICNELRRYATFYRNIPQGFAAGCRLPDSFVTADGRTIQCPAAWMPPTTPPDWDSHHLGGTAPNCRTEMSQTAEWLLTQGTSICYNPSNFHEKLQKVIN